MPRRWPQPLSSGKPFVPSFLASLSALGDRCQAKRGDRAHFRVFGNFEWPASGNHPPAGALDGTMLAGPGTTAISEWTTTNADDAITFRAQDHGRPSLTLRKVARARLGIDLVVNDRTHDAHLHPHDSWRRPGRHSAEWPSAHGTYESNATLGPNEILGKLRLFRPLSAGHLALFGPPGPRTR